MTELILTSYQARVFGEVEQLLETRGNPSGVKVNPRAYYLSKKIAVYIINNIAKNQKDGNIGIGETSNDAENVYNYIFNITPVSLAPTNTEVSDTSTTETPITNSIELSRAYINLNNAISDNLSSYTSLDGDVLGALTVSYVGTIAANKPLNKTNGNISFSDFTIFDFNTPRLTNNFVYFFKIAKSPLTDQSITTGDVLEISFDITDFNTSTIAITNTAVYTGGTGRLKVNNIRKQSSTSNGNNQGNGLGNNDGSSGYAIDPI